jgi:hypothetical protein
MRWHKRCSFRDEPLEELTMRTLLIALVSFILIDLIDGRAFAQTSVEQRAILSCFERSVAAYAAQFDWSTEQQMPAVEAAPVIFTLPVSVVFRQLIATALGDSQVATMSAPSRPRDHRLDVYAPFPLADSALPSQVVRDALPALPARLEYRLVGGDLVLRDTQLNIVVAVLHDAIRHGANRLLTHGR